MLVGGLNNGQISCALKIKYQNKYLQTFANYFKNISAKNILHTFYSCTIIIFADL